jgi:multidrug resistance efflux pump
VSALLRPGLCALACAAGAACGGEQARPVAGEQVRTAKLARGDIVERQVLSGELRAATSVALTVPRTEQWQMTIRWLAEDGVIVKAGDKVVEFDNSAFTAQLEEKHLGVLEAEMTLRGAQALGAIESAAKQTELRQHRIALEKATVRAGVPADLLTGRDAQERQLEKKRAEVAVEKAEHTLGAQRDELALDLRVKQIELDKARRAIAAAEKTIADLVLVAPRGGLIVVEEHPWLGRKIQLGDTMPPGMNVVSLPDMTEAMQVHAELSDVDDGRVGIGMTGTCVLDAYPGEPIACKVKELTPVARSKGESSLRRAFTVKLELGKTDPARMRPGMSVKVELQPRALAGAVVAPRGAIAPAEPGAPPRLRMVAGGLREVKLGPCDAQACVVESGAAEGDAVVVGGAP